MTTVNRFTENMMTTTYPISILPMVETVIDETTGETISTETDDWYIFPDEVRVQLTPILARHGYAQELGEFPDADWLLSRIEFEVRFKSKLKPWVLVFFEEEYPIIGHVVTSRKDAGGLRCSGYSLIRPDAEDFDPTNGVAPPVSMLWIFSKDALQDAAKSGSPLFAALQAELGGLDEEGSWIHFAAPLDPLWVSNQADSNNELFFSFLNCR